MIRAGPLAVVAATAVASTCAPAPVNSFPFGGAGYSGSLSPPPPPPPPGTAVTTYTVSNTSTLPLPAGTFITGGQGFRRGDVPAGNCVKIQNSAGVDLVKQQVDGIATRRENGDDNSIRHLVWSAQTDAPIPAGGNYQINFALTGAPCVAGTNVLTLAALASHDLKLDFADFRNQDATIRRSGHAVFNLNQARLNTGRDAPRCYMQGPVVTGCMIQGPPLDATSGLPDPMLYVQCYVDLIVDPATQSTLGNIRHSCLVTNPWMNVTAGTVGNSGAPGPVGLTNDPQAVSYRPTLLDGSTVQLDWAWWDQSVTAASNPVTTNAANPGGCTGGLIYGNGDWTFPNSQGLNAIQHGTAYLYHTTGTPPAGMVNDTIYWIFAVGNYNGPVTTNPSVLEKVHLMNSPFAIGCTSATTSIDPTSQGTGTHNFAYRVWQMTHTAWLSTDQIGADNYTNSAGVRTAGVIYPALTADEQTYWKETGLIPPVRNTVGMSDPIDYSGDIVQHVYSPLGRGNMHAGNTPGIHSDLAQISEYHAQAFLGETKLLWDHAQIGALSYWGLPWASILNERTARVPAINNGPPGANHAGSGASYSALGAPFGQTNPVTITRYTQPFFTGLAPALDNVPLNIGNQGWYRGGSRGTENIDNSHFGSYANGIYQIWGRQRDLALMQAAGNRGHQWVFIGPGAGRQTNVIDGVTWYATLAYCCEGRGEENAYRDSSLPMMFGADTLDERTYFNDMALENYYFQLAYDCFIDGPGQTNFQSNFTDPWQTPTGGDTFIDSYGAQMAYQAYAATHDPLSLYFLNHYLQLYITACSDTDPNYVIPSLYCAIFQYIPNVKNGAGILHTAGQPYLAPNTGQYYAGDSSERGLVPNGWSFTAGSGRICQSPTFALIYLSNGDKAKNFGLLYTGPDELDPTVWYTITQVENTNVGGSTDCFRLINPATGTPFTSYSVAGVPFTQSYTYLKTRPTANRPGWISSYSVYAQPVMFALKSLGFSAINTAISVMSNRSVQDGNPAGFVDPGPVNVRQNWDPGVSVP